MIKLATSEEVTREGVREHLGRVVEGKAVEFCDEELARRVDGERVRRGYKLGIGEGVAGRELEGLVLGVMALRGAG